MNGGYIEMEPTGKRRRESEHDSLPPGGDVTTAAVLERPGGAFKEPGSPRRVELPHSRRANRLGAVPGREQDPFESFAHLARPEDGDLDAVAAVAGAHLLVCVTGLVDGRREVVALEYHPLPQGFIPDAGGDFIQVRMESALDRVREEGGTPPPLSASVIRMPLGPLLAYRQQVSEGADFQLSVVSPARVAELSGRDRMALPYLDDALMYVQALERNESPAALISRVRGISISYARNRISKARALDLLTPAEKSVAAGGLTDTARRLVAWRDGTA